MRALVSGQAALAVAFGATPEVRPLDREPFSVTDPSAVQRLFAGCTDIIEITVSNATEIDVRLELAWAQDRALRLCLIILDPTEGDDDIFDAADSLEELLSAHAIKDFILDRFSAVYVKADVAARDWGTLLASYPLSRELVEVAAQLKAASDQVFGRFYSLSPAVFERGDAGRDALLSSLSKKDFVAKLIRSLSVGEDINFLKLEMIKSTLPHRVAIEAWLSGLQNKTSRRERRIYDKDSDDEMFDDKLNSREERAPNAAAYQQVRLQQKFIVDLLKERQVDKARAVVQDLIKHQRANSTKEQIGKTLSLLAQQAKLQDIREIHYEWALWATQENPEDPKTFGHLSDACMGLGRFEEASTALDKAESVGGRLFAEGGRARILRATGKLLPARQKYLEAAREFQDWPSVEYALIGAADVLIEMGKSPEAIVELEQITRDFPFATAGWSSLAAAQIDIGRVDEALVSVGKSAANRRNLNALVMRADVIARSGQTEAAKRIYEELVERYPNNSDVLCGQARMLLNAGEIDMSRSTYDLAIERCPFSPEPLVGRARLSYECDDLHSAMLSFNAAKKKFPYYRQAEIGLLRCLLRLQRFDEAASMSRSLLAEYDHAGQARIVLARALLGLQRYEEALEEIEALLHDNPGHVAGLSAKANILIRLKRFGESSVLLPDVHPRTQSDWARFVLRTIDASVKSGRDVTLNKLNWALARCPFYSQRRLIRSTFAHFLLQDGKRDEAIDLVEQRPSEVNSVIEFEVFAEARDRKRAAAVLNRIEMNGESQQALDLAVEIGRRTSVLSGPSAKSVAWEREQHIELLLDQAA